MMIYEVKYTIVFLFFWVYSSTAIPSTYLMKVNEDRDKEIAAILSSNNYIAKKGDLSKNKDTPQDTDDESTVLLSKLSDQQLISLLKKQPQLDSLDEFDIQQAVKNSEEKTSKKKKDSAVKDESAVTDQGAAYFRIDNKEVEPFKFNSAANPDYLSNQRVKNLLYSHPTKDLGYDDDDEPDDEKKELIFDILTAQLKKLCCKSSEPEKKSVKKAVYEPLLGDLFSNLDTKISENLLQYEQIFLILNDEINTEQYSDSDIINVDPDSLNQNSTVLLLGPITRPLSDSQIKTAMDWITTELSGPEYSPLLQELAKGKVNKSNTRLVKSLVSGSNTRRYIKPHRCRTRYPQAQGPKWLICTGYLNINTPSLYD